MNDATGRSSDYRYSVGPESAKLTPMAQIEVFFGPLTFQVLNVSKGGVAMLFGSEPKMKTGDIIDAAVSIRDRAFPVQLEMKAIRGLRVSAAYVNPSDLFLGALKEFLQPKSLGVTLKKNAYLSAFPDIKNLVAASKTVEIYQGINLSFLAAWLKDNREIDLLLSVAHDVFICWTPRAGLKCGRLQSALESSPELIDLLLKSNFSEDQSEFQIPGAIWEREPENAIRNYFADILLSWAPSEIAQEFVETLFKAPDNIMSQNLIKVVFLPVSQDSRS